MASKTFSDLGVHQKLVDRLNQQNITEPFPIQELAIPMALKGADVIGQARTGTGKTLAFGIPLLQRIDPDRQQTQAFVIVPTRELCLQVTDDLTLGEDLGIRVTSVYGGVGYEDQNRELTTGVHVVVGTPGRLLDQLNRRNLDLSGVRELVLDEADEMLDMGFLPDVERLIEACADDRHTMLFSATMPTEVVKLARRYMTKPTFLRADTEDHEVAPTVEQHFFLVHRMDKPRLLARILQQPERGAVYVFTRTKRMADRLVEELGKLNTKALAIHGDLRQSSRERNMDRFREGNVDVLVATEVAARGLDVENATHVVNYDCPDDHKMYLHRIGRTARAGASGVAITFAEFNEVDRLNVIRKRVEAEREIVEVFSTSDEITERFDLPERTPWDHLSKSEAGSRDEARARKGKSDGRSQNRRDTEGRGGGHDADRSRRRPSRETAEAPEKRERPDPKQEERSRERASSGRSRDRSSDASRDTSRPRDRRPPAERAEKILAKKDDRAEQVRTRTRSVPSPEDAEQREDSRGRDDSRGRTRARARQDRGDDTERSSRGDSRSSSEGRDEKSRARDRGDRDRGDRDRSSRDRSSRDRSSRDRSSRDRSSRDRSGRDRSTADRGNGNGRRGDSEPDTSKPWLEPTAPGDEARGDGHPQSARRVKVEHLP